MRQVQKKREKRFEFSDYQGKAAVVPVIMLSGLTFSVLGYFLRFAVE